MLAEIQAVSEHAKGISAPGMSNQPILNTEKKRLATQFETSVYNRLAQGALIKSGIYIFFSADIC